MKKRRVYKNNEKREKRILTKKFALKNNLINKFLILLRYLILLGLMFTLPLIYKTLTPLTVYPSLFLLGLFYEVAIRDLLIIIDNQTFIQIIPACIAGSAYLLLLILNLTLPIKFKKRISLILLSFFILLILNISRIFFLSVLYHNNFIFFDITHKLFWYFISTIFVIGIWFFIVKQYEIKEIPIYDDFRYLTKEI